MFVFVEAVRCVRWMLTLLATQNRKGYVYLR